MSTRKVATGITRFDFEDRQGFMVRICRNGKHVNEFFSAKRCGGIRKAQKAAEARYDELLAEHGPAVMAPKNRKTIRNTTGKVGVHVAYSIDGRWPDCEYWAYCASWVTPDGKRGKIQFSWNKYGEQLAWELACLARDQESTDRDAIIAFHTKQVQSRLRRLKRKSRSR